MYFKMYSSLHYRIVYCCFIGIVLIGVYAIESLLAPNLHAVNMEDYCLLFIYESIN